MDRWKTNLAGRVLDPVCPIAQLWQNSLLAEQEKMGLEFVINLTRRAVAHEPKTAFCVALNSK